MALDYKGLDYRTRNLVPGPHRLVTERLAPRSHVPILVDGERVIQGSSEIIDYLAKRCPGARLTPVGASAAQEAHEWERYLDREIGVTIRRWFYFHILPERKLAARFLLQGAPGTGLRSMPSSSRPCGAPCARSCASTPRTPRAPSCNCAPLWCT
ncbi:MAG: glutathione S-transferase N-terminal domain-containing protein [Pseudomonadota bacterium]|nr:glutathione S-transferase N-terminal domain-containing protein [Pseudomonadota bacterium]